MSNPSNRKALRNAQLYEIRVRDKLTFAALGRLFKIAPSTARLLFNQFQSQLPKPLSENQLFLRKMQKNAALLRNLQIIALQLRLITEPLPNGEFARKRKNW